MKKIVTSDIYTRMSVLVNKYICLYVITPYNRNTVYTIYVWLGVFMVFDGYGPLAWSLVVRGWSLLLGDGLMG